MADISKFIPARNPPDVDVSKPFIGYPMILRGKPQTQGNIHVPTANAYLPDSLRGSNDVVPPTVYEHCKNSNIPAAASEEITVDFQPNILDNYDVYTYHFKLFITSLANSTSGKVLDPESQTIIAESGISDLTIDNVEFQGIAVPSLEAGTGTQTLLKFQLFEPGGAGLLDKLYYESLALGIGNWLVMPCYLQLEFRGRTTASSVPVTTGDPGTLGGLQWIWPLKLTDIKANVSAGGTKYDVNAIFYDEFAQSNACFSAQHSISLQGLKTFGDAITQLKDKLNADAYEKTLDNYSLPDSYEIFVDEQLKGVEIAIPEQNKTSTRGADYIDFEKKSAMFNPGTSIDKMIDVLLGSSKYYQEALQSARTRTSTPEAANAAAPMRDFWRIITETKPIGFDMLRQDNAVQITIYIVKYNLGLVEADASQTGQTPDTRVAARKRLATYNNTGILRKKYNYIFTGLNDQVINFDLNMNCSFAATLSRFGGIYLDSNNSDIGVVQRPPLSAVQDAVERTRTALRYISNPKNKDTVDTELVHAKLAVANTNNIDPSTKNRLNEILKHAKSQDRTTYVADIQKAGGLDADGELNRSKQIAKSLAAPTLTNPVRKFVSDVNSGSEEAQKVRQNAEDSRRGKLRPKPFREGAQEQNLMGMDSNSDAGRARTSSIFSTALYSTMDASLVSIKLTIKGDPFWLYPRNTPIDGILPYKSNLDDKVAINLIKLGHLKDKSTVNPFGTDNFIVLRFRTPKVYNNDTGYTESYTEVETFSGIYKVVSINSKFENGKFTQEMSCILDDLINLKDFPDFIKQIEEENKKPDPVIDTDNIITESAIPGTAQITDKIKSGGANLVKGAVDTYRDAKGVVVTTTTTFVDADGWTTHLKESSNIPTLTNAQEAINARLRR